jgi:osmotically-inducible protein OsmY
MRSTLTTQSWFHALFLRAIPLCFAALLLSPTAAEAAPDAWVTAKVKMALVAAEGIPGAQVRVDTTSGRVTLFGEVATNAEKTKAEEVARGIQGVRSIRNLLVVANKPAPAGGEARLSDAELKQSVERALQQDDALAGTAIEVRSAQAGVVYLSGRARTFSEHRRAIGTAAGVLGVRRVESDVVAPEELTDAEIGRDAPFDATEYAKATASDMWLTTAVKTRLLADDQTPGFEINVDASDGRVTLFGSVDSDQTKRRAEAEARKVAGVRDVENALQVVAPAAQPTVARVDADLAKEVETRISERPELATNDVTVQVENAVVRLTGTIDGSGDRLAALTAARGVVGVTKVIDDLRVEPPAVGAR